MREDRAESRFTYGTKVTFIKLESHTWLDSHIGFPGWSPAAIWLFGIFLSELALGPIYTQIILRVSGSSLDYVKVRE